MRGTAKGARRDERNGQRAAGAVGRESRAPDNERAREHDRDADTRLREA